MNRVIEVIISPTGQATVQTKGFSGASCQEASRLLERALGAKTQETLTAEFHQGANQQQQLQEGG